MKWPKIDQVVSKVFLVLFLLSLPIVWVRILTVGEKSINTSENRAAYKVPALTARSFLDKTFQEGLESALSDQIPGGNAIKKAKRDSDNAIYKHLSFLSYNPNSKYQLVGNGVYSFDNAEWLLWKKPEIEQITEASEGVKKAANFYSSLDIKNKFIYVIPNEGAIDFDNFNLDNIDKIAKLYKGYKCKHLPINSFEDYKEYYLKNDHHWNYKGQYQGYRDIIGMILGKDEKLHKPVETVNFNYNIIGSKTTVNGFYDYKEPFTAYRFNIEKHDCYINGEKREYGSQDDYFNNPILREGWGDITYGDFYGDNYALVEYDFSKPDKDNLLIIGYSDTNAVNTLIASHFNRTFIVDPRYMNLDSFNKLLKDNDIDDILLLPNMVLFLSDYIIISENV